VKDIQLRIASNLRAIPASDLLTTKAASNRFLNINARSEAHQKTHATGERGLSAA
jgi:hypothetical protein